MKSDLKVDARRGAVGKTARWAAHLYRRWVRLAPKDPVALDSVLGALIATRYDIDACIYPGGCSCRIRSALGVLHEAGQNNSSP
ncbi:MAG: hypothetical protein OXP09_11105 [Gammaproteobacteria bacterium]|nr:hypothetical protein [Gammaproteobacteria bacterium]MDE0366106.1 hypothetical protein [Gammaproteobacteria bacterium]